MSGELLVSPFSGDSNDPTPERKSIPTEPLEPIAIERSVVVESQIYCAPPTIENTNETAMTDEVTETVSIILESSEVNHDDHMETTRASHAESKAYVPEKVVEETQAIPHEAGDRRVVKIQKDRVEADSELMCSPKTQEEPILMREDTMRNDMEDEGDSDDVPLTQKRVRTDLSTQSSPHPTIKRIKSEYLTPVVRRSPRSPRATRYTNANFKTQPTVKIERNEYAPGQDPADEYPKVINPSRERCTEEKRRPLYHWGKGIEPAYLVLRKEWGRQNGDAEAELRRKIFEIELDHKKIIEQNGPDYKPRTKKATPAPTDENLEPVHRWWLRANSLAPGEELHTAPWPYFEHHGMIFSPPYEPHRQPLIVRGNPTVLPPEPEELCNFWCAALTSDYATKDAFRANFWEAFENSLPKGHEILNTSQSDGGPITFDDLDFSIINDFLIQRKDENTAAQKARLPAVKLLEKEKKEQQNNHFGRAIIGGLREKVQQFRTEPPSLFRPRGAHPQMGKLKRRTFPEMVSINSSRDAPVPLLDPTYLHGHCWADVLHKNDVTWLSFYRDTVMSQYKYMYLSSSSGTKGQSDFKKYEKARKLQYRIDAIRELYTRGMLKGDVREKQLGLAVYLIDRLALRAGNDKEDDEADTVGCCSLRREHLTLLTEKTDDGRPQVFFDFLGKDSIPYQATVPMDDLPFKIMGQLLAKKKPEDQLFDAIDPTSLNKQLQEWAGMSVSAKVFRTYNASITLQQELARFDEMTVDDTDITTLKAFYDLCNRQVAVLCNHQRAAPKSFDATLEKMRLRLKQIDDDIEELQSWLKWHDGSQKNDFKFEPSPPAETLYGITLPPRKSALPVRPKVDAVQRRLDTRLKTKADKDVELETKEANRTVATGTSRMHYMDPRITVAFCKKRNIPIQKVFQKTLVMKFPWAMNVSQDFVW